MLKRLIKKNILANKIKCPQSLSLIIPPLKTGERFLIYKCNKDTGMISLRNQNGAITGIVITSALFGERSNLDIKKILKNK